MKVSINDLRNKVIVNENNNTVKVQIGGIQGAKGGGSGDGITAINDLTELAQFIETGTDGNDINIVSAVDTHTINIPTASATIRGALSSADWTTFNNKLNSFSYTPEDVANKENTTLDISTTKYPTNNLVKTNLDLKASKIDAIVAALIFGS